MPTSNSRLSYIDCYEHLDQALMSVKGIRIKFADEGAARSHQLRLNKARRLTREDNAETYPSDHPLHGRSEYDCLQIRLRENGEGWVLLLEQTNRSMEIEEI